MAIVTQIWVCISMLFLPESPRWLVESQNLEEAEKVFRKIAEWNKKGDSFFFSKKFFTKGERAEEFRDSVSEKNLLNS